jgi:hypothetical protein
MLRLPLHLLTLLDRHPTPKLRTTTVITERLGTVSAHRS